ncbi:sensor histidine kinase [Novosphingobium beihaiensis]|uniref:histidine kinase n=1 Tax=Novosphingobium beihaiensis TaxID=2930389 RepID=A0ABT0BVG5_9SPHN|nr:HAMP domain-containing sensor histidine kinase [Novosphingobium beihaiensis]MCJ2189058.1 HAMP domain-containing histidine kinase [Novosphingobium beihaiensis]
MDSRRFPVRRAVSVAAAQVLLFGLGGAAAAAWHGGLYVSMVLSLLLAAWLGTVALLRLLPPRRGQKTAREPDRREQTERVMLRAVIAQAPVPLLAIEDDGRVHALNRAARLLFDTGDIVLSPPVELTGNGKRFRKNGRVLRIDRIVAQDAGPVRAILVLIDIEAEERMAEARATRELLEVLSHEVMNALTPVVSLSESARELLDEPTPPLEPLRNILGTLARRTGGLLHFTSAYRELARLPEPTIAAVSLPMLFDDLARMFAARWGPRVALTCSVPGTLSVKADREQLSQALWALLQNGAEAALEHASAPAVMLSAQAGEAVILRVADNGPGVPGDQKDRIFRPFTTTKPQGNGVGLSLAQQIVRSHGSEIVLADRDMGGASFELMLIAR